MSRPRQPRRALLTLLCLIPLLTAATWQWLPHDAGERPTVAVGRADIEASVTALGTLQPRRYVDVGAQASGQIRKLHVEVGDEVTQGQLLVEIDPATQQARYDAERYAIDQLKAQVREQQAEQRLAQQQWQRQQRLAADGATRAEEVQSARAKLDTTQARVDQLQAQVLQAQASMRSAEAELGYTRIYAPMTGTVVAVDAREGQTLNAQQRTPLILRIARLSPMTVWAEVSEADIGQIKTGMPAYFTTLGGNQRRWRSTVRQILPIPPKPLEQLSQGGGSPAAAGQGANNRVVLYTVLLDVDNADNALLADMTAQVFFVAGSASNVLTAPIAALQQQPGESGRQTAQVLTQNGQVEQRPVRTGLSDRLRVQILEGLHEGERLLIGPTAGHEG